MVRTRKTGFTFVELLTVLFIIGLLVAISVGVARYAYASATRERAVTDLHLVADALDRYYLEFGEYPDGSTVSNLLEHTRPIIENGETFKFARLLPPGFPWNDPWKSLYRYKIVDEGVLNDADATPFYILYSYGPDRKEGTADDISYP